MRNNLGLHNACRTPLSQLADCQSANNARQVSGLRRPCEWCGLAESRKHTFHCSDECRFWSKVKKGPNCWLWTGGKHTEGYGQFSLTINGVRRPIGAHVFSYHIATGAPLLSTWVLHHCDVRLCVRPDHLFGGDHTANMRDAAAKGRLHTPRPSRQKVTDAECAEIIHAVLTGPRGTATRMAEAHGVTRTFVSKLVKGQLRQHSNLPIRPSLQQVG